VAGLYMGSPAARVNRNSGKGQVAGQWQTSMRRGVGRRWAGVDSWWSLRRPKPDTRIARSQNFR